MALVTNDNTEGIIHDPDCLKFAEFYSLRRKVSIKISKKIVVYEDA